MNPGLLHYLNAFKNKKNNPNENLGRELLELYTVGEVIFRRRCQEYFYSLDRI